MHPSVSAHHLWILQEATVGVAIDLLKIWVLNFVVGHQLESSPIHVLVALLHPKHIIANASLAAPAFCCGESACEKQNNRTLVHSVGKRVPTP